LRDRRRKGETGGGREEGEGWGLGGGAHNQRCSISLERVGGSDEREIYRERRIE